jgi:MFS family permease
MARQRVDLGPSYRKVYWATAMSNIGDGMAGIAYPWLASALTRNPLLIGSVAVAQRLPWMLFSLPAGVITDRVDRKLLMVRMDMIRFALTALVAFVVLSEQSGLPAPDALDDVVGTRAALYLVLLLATLLLGCAEVLRDNSNQTLLPAIVDADHLERANGRIWSIEMVANTFIGPPLGTLLLSAAFALPFFFDAASFFAAAALVFSIPGSFRAERSVEHDVPSGYVPYDAATLHVGRSWRAELVEGVRWLWNHHLLRDMAIILGVMNLANMVTGSMLVLFAQEVIGADKPWEFTVMGFGFAVGGIVGGYLAPAMSERFGSGTCLAIALGSGALFPLLIAAQSFWPVVAVIFAFEIMLGTVWNVITVSLRQTIIPSELLGRVNSVYRFFAWGMMPIGALLGGATVAVVDVFASREMALRATWLVSAAIGMVLFVAGRALLTTEKLEAARAAAAQANS